jgi:hypothetical protein
MPRAPCSPATWAHLTSAFQPSLIAILIAGIVIAPAIWANRR